MNSRNYYSLLSTDDCMLIHHNVLEILGKIGVKIENEEMIKYLKRTGAKIDLKNKIVYFPKEVVEETINTLSEYKPDETELPKFNAGGNAIRYLDNNGNIKNHTLESSANYTRLGDSLENIDTMNCMGYPSDVPPKMQPFYLKMLSWKNTNKPYSAGGDLISTPVEFEYFKEMCEIYCDQTGKEVASEAAVLIHKSYPLFLDSIKASLFLKAWENGVDAAIAGGIPSVAGSAPGTIAGALSLCIADKLMSAVINLAFFKDRWIKGYMGIDAKKYPLYYDMSVLDLRNGFACMSHPESWQLIVGLGDMSRFYKIGFGHGGYGKTQAKKIDSVQSGVERISELLIGYMSGAHFFGSLGTISEPEGITSAIQLIIDNEIAGMLKNFARGFKIDHEHLAYDVIKAVGHKGLYLGEIHTVRHMREELWFSEVFLGGEDYDFWIENNNHTEIENAMEIYNNLLAKENKTYLKGELEMEINKYIKKISSILG